MAKNTLHDDFIVNLIKQFIC